MTVAKLHRRLTQVATGVVIAAGVVLLTQWAYPAGNLSIRLGHPYYERAAGINSTLVTIDITLKNVGTSVVEIDRERFLVVDDTGHTYRSDPSTHFLRNHFDVLRLPPGRELRGATVFQLPQERTAARMMFITSTGQFVWFRLR